MGIETQYNWLVVLIGSYMYFSWFSPHSWDERIFALTFLGTAQPTTTMWWNGCKTAKGIGPNSIHKLKGVMGWIHWKSWVALREHLTGKHDTAWFVYHEVSSFLGFSQVFNLFSMVFLRFSHGFPWFFLGVFRWIPRSGCKTPWRSMPYALFLGPLRGGVATERSCWFHGDFMLLIMVNDG